MYDSENINSKILLLFIGVSLFSFFFYILKHPLFHLISYGVNRSALVSIYMPDLFIYLSVLLPYEITLVCLFVMTVKFHKKIADRDPSFRSVVSQYVRITNCYPVKISLKQE